MKSEDLSSQYVHMSVETESNEYCFKNFKSKVAPYSYNQSKAEMYYIIYNHLAATNKSPNMTIVCIFLTFLKVNFLH